MSLIARLGVVLGLNIEEFVKGTDEATKKTREYQYQLRKEIRKTEEAIGAAFNQMSIAAVAFGAALMTAFEKADEISDIAKGFDTTVEKLLATQSALQGAGGNAEDAAQMFQKLAIAQDNAREGSDEVRQSFERLGIAGNKVDSLRLDDLFKEVATALSGVEDAGKRAALAQDIFGKAVKGINWADFVEKYKEFSNPSLVKAIETNAEAWENIEKAAKEFKLALIQIAEPFARLVNYSASFAKNMRDAVDAATDKNISMLPGGLGIGGKRNDPTGEKARERIAMQNMMGGYDYEAPIVGYDDTSGYGKKSAKELAAQKKAEDEAKRIKEARATLETEIKLIEQKAALAQKVFDINSKGVILGSQAISQEKMRLDLENDIATIRANAQKERVKDKAQIDLINKKEAAEISARVAQYGYDTSLQMQQRKRDHELAMQSLQDEGIKKRDALSVQAMGEHDLLDLEKQRFALGNSAYALQKQDIETQNKLREIRTQYLEQSKAINTEYERSAKSAEDFENFETKMDELRRNQSAQINYTVGIEQKKKEVLQEQLDLEDKLFRLDLQRQTESDISNIRAALGVEQERHRLELSRYAMSVNQYNMSRLLLDNAQALIAIEKKYNDEKAAAYYQMKMAGETVQAREQYETRLKSIEQIKQIEMDAIREVGQMKEEELQRDITRQQSWVAGWEDAARQYQENTDKAFNRGAAAFGSVMANMDAALSSFVETGKFKFGEFATAVVKDIIRMELQAQAATLFRMLLGSIGSSVSLSGIGAQPNVPYGGYTNVGVGFQTRAAGGDINGPTIVGENGPELFIPSQRGTIIPNTIAPNMAGMGQPQVVYNGPYIQNMSAIDTQSAAQFLSKNKMSVWSANKSADRSVPVSR